ncbi:MAG: deoxyribose-phosphate aldolase [Myxococcales bacterium]|nr:deoxyribose-phosphate aldolase [Myxococcales bacterium]USN51174.1 MAG: deoxyribose-phosphate aldolase [Myxococcales bacterium]
MANLNSSSQITSKKLASMIEHTLLAGDLNEERILTHLNEALRLKVFGVCIPLAWVPIAKEYLAQSSIKIITVIDFPFGQKSCEEKAQEARVAVSLGADEIDMVLDYEALIAKNYDKALEDVTAVVHAAGPIPVKVIVETSALDKAQLASAITIVALSKAQFIKTSTGFHKAGAQAQDIALMRHLLPDHIGIKASGGIKDFSSALAMIKAGATRIGASRSQEILQGC